MIILFVIKIVDTLTFAATISYYEGISLRFYCEGPGDGGDLKYMIFANLALFSIC